MVTKHSFLDDLHDWNVKRRLSDDPPPPPLLPPPPSHPFINLYFGYLRFYLYVVCSLGHSVVFQSVP